MTSNTDGKKNTHDDGVFIVPRPSPVNGRLIHNKSIFFDSFPFISRVIPFHWQIEKIMSSFGAGIVRQSVFEQEGYDQQISQHLTQPVNGEKGKLRRDVLIYVEVGVGDWMKEKSRLSKMGALPWSGISPSKQNKRRGKKKKQKTRKNKQTETIRIQIDSSREIPPKLL